ncbi:unnamed protein product [Hymenolepis diminuta]|uniref:Aa_trans domain-containing protein n=1 Tax=Hymenolepis diminuta TaxID=6216 RepID=A0A0R3SFT3_HYMDI|nr:unnamed protein product [Hymenolepis diminuta]
MVASSVLQCWNYLESPYTGFVYGSLEEIKVFSFIHFFKAAAQVPIQLLEKVMISVTVWAGVEIKVISIAAILFLASVNVMVFSAVPSSSVIIVVLLLCSIGTPEDTVFFIYVPKFLK